MQSFLQACTEGIHQVYVNSKKFAWSVNTLLSHYLSLTSFIVNHASKDIVRRRAIIPTALSSRSRRRADPCPSVRNVVNYASRNEYIPNAHAMRRRKL
jgi:hypothetical protein